MPPYNPYSVCFTAGHIASKPHPALISNAHLLLTTNSAQAPYFCPLPPPPSTRPRDVFAHVTIVLEFAAHIARAPPTSYPVLVPGSMYCNTAVVVVLSFLVFTVHSMITCICRRKTIAIISNRLLYIVVRTTGGTESHVKHWLQYGTVRNWHF